MTQVSSLLTSRHLKRFTSQLTIPWMTQVECLFAGFKGEEPFYRPPVHGARPSDSTELTQNSLLEDLRRYTVRSRYRSTMFYTDDLDTSLIIITSICYTLYIFDPSLYIFSILSNHTFKVLSWHSCHLVSCQMNSESGLRHPQIFYYGISPKTALLSRRWRPRCTWTCLCSAQVTLHASMSTSFVLQVCLRTLSLQKICRLRSLAFVRSVGSAVLKGTRGCLHGVDFRGKVEDLPNWYKRTCFDCRLGSLTNWVYFLPMFGLLLQENITTWVVWQKYTWNLTETHWRYGSHQLKLFNSAVNFVISAHWLSISTTSVMWAPCLKPLHRVCKTMPTRSGQSCLATQSSNFGIVTNEETEGERMRKICKSFPSCFCDA